MGRDYKASAQMTLFIMDAYLSIADKAVWQHMPHMLKKQRVHLILHLVECMEQFGLTFNSER